MIWSSCFRIVLLLVFIPLGTALADVVNCESIAASPSSYYGKDVHVLCEFVSSKKSSEAVFLNSRSDWKNGFSLVIWDTYLSNFPSSPETFYLNKTMVVQGVVKQHKAKPSNTDRPQILLKTKSQILSLEE